MSSIFTRIIKGEVSSYKILESHLFYSFLDTSPLVMGHSLVVPKIEVDKIYNLPDQYLYELLIFSKPIALAIEKSFPCLRCGFSVVGLEVSHAHMHLIPINSADDLNFTRPKLKISQEDLKSAQDKILSNL